jgi:hypothetical protein
MHVQEPGLPWFLFDQWKDKLVKSGQIHFLNVHVECNLLFARSTALFHSSAAHYLQVRVYALASVTQTLYELLLIISQLDYCSIALAGVSATFQWYQLVVNIVA